MRSEIVPLIRALIGNARQKRDRIMSVKLAQLGEKIPAGHGARRVQFGRACAEEMENRVDLWLTISRRVFGETHTSWSSVSTPTVATALQEELVIDTRALDGLYKSKFKSEERIDSAPGLTEAYESASECVPLELQLLQLSEEAARIPLSEQLASPRYASVLSAWSRANGTFHGSDADYKAVVMEAIAAVEQLGRLIARRPTATLGDALRGIRKSGRIPVPLLKGVEELWGWASSEPGLRHGASTDSPVDATAASYALALAEGALALLIARDTE